MLYVVLYAVAYSKCCSIYYIRCYIMHYVLNNTVLYSICCVTYSTCICYSAIYAVLSIIHYILFGCVPEEDDDDKYTINYLIAPFSHSLSLQSAIAFLRVDFGVYLNCTVITQYAISLS